jgi:myosin heavy subunit
VFFLESLSENGEQALVPGDLISYYAVAEDRENSARTDMFFIDVQPFDRRYSQSQQAGGAGQQGGPQNEVSERQREIIISTWNLIREQSDQRRGDDAYVADNAALLSRLQQTLKEQVETLAERAEARQLTVSDEEIAEFVEHLYKAAEAMTPATERLAEIELEEALLPEQEALQHLLAAEAVFTDINVSMQANNGGGGQAGRDLSEMFELEMDLEKNQYETGSNATPNPPEQQIEEAANELEELARRQEQLARNQSRSQTPTPEQRWQQEMLRRDVEELQRQLEELSRGQQQAQSQSSQGQSGSESSESQSSNSEPTEREIDELQRRLSSAMRAMNEADEAMRDSADPESLQRAMDEAQRQLEGARDSAGEAQQRAMQAAVDELAKRADELHDTQVDLEERIQNAVREILNEDGEGDPFNSGLSYDEEAEMAAEKRDLLADIQRLQRDAQGTAQTIEDDQPRVADEIRDGVSKLQDMEIEARIAVAAAYIEQGEAVYVAASESAVTEALRQLREDLRRAEGMISSAADGESDQGERMQASLDGVRALRRALQQAATEDGGGQGGVRTGWPDERVESTGERAEDLEVAPALQQQAQEVSQEATALLRTLSNTGMEARDVDQIRQLAADIQASDFSGNPDVLAREARQALALVEQLELRLAKAVSSDERGIRSAIDEEVPEQHRKIVADYYRKLGQADAEE